MRILTTILSFVLLTILIACNSELQKRPVGVQFHKETLKRLGARGDNWCLTWASDGSQITSMCDGNWLEDPYGYHNRLYRLIGEPDSFIREDVSGYPRFFSELSGWFGYGVVAIDSIIYSMVSLTPEPDWSGPFRGIKMVKSSDNGYTWSRVNYRGEEKFIDSFDGDMLDDISGDEMFFMEEYGKNAHGQQAYPFSFCSFVQQGKAHDAASDDFIYIYAPEGSQTNELNLARVDKNEIEQRDQWEYFKNWDGSTPLWTDKIEERGMVYEYPAGNDSSEYFGWYSWLPSVVWNPGLELYIMVNGGTYGGHGMTDSQDDYYSGWMHSKTGSVGLWYSEDPYGPWTQFYYSDYWTVDDAKNKTYQPKLSPKWISEDGTKMILIWSDAMDNERGESHDINYMWNQMEITILLEGQL